MPSREPELYKDKIEVSLDGRQIFYLFFGGAVIVGMVFVLGVMVGRRVEARGHLDRADTQAASDPLAALDRLERSDHLSFHGALTGSEAPTDVEKAIGELDKRRAAGQPEKAARPPAAASPAGGEARQVRPEAVSSRPEAAAAHPESRPEPRPDPEAHGDAAPRPDADKPRSDKRDGDKRDADKSDRKARKHDDGGSQDGREPRDAHADGKPTGHDGKSSAKTEGRSAEAKGRFTLQLSSFQDRSEAEAFLNATRSAGFQPYLTEADVTGRGTFYRVRLGSYRSLEAANDARAEYEKAARKTAQVMRL